MKRLLIIYLAVIGVTSLHAQEAFVPINYSALEKKIQKSELEIADPKKGIDPKIWIKRGEIMLSVFDVDLEQTYEGMNPTNLQLFYKEPVISKEEFDGKSYDVYSYPRIKFYFEGGTLAMYDRLKIAYENPLDEAYRSLTKAGELDIEGKLTEKLFIDYNKLKNLLKKNGINNYYRGNKDEALKSFEMVLLINKKPVLKGEIDTIMIQYSGIIARELNYTEKAIQHYTELSTVDKQPNTFLQLKEDYLRLKDTVNAIGTMERAFVKYPDTLNVVANLVDLYIRANKITEGLVSINKALENSPEKGEFYYWKGRLQLNSTEENRIDLALKSYEMAIEKNPNLYYAYYDVGYIYFLQGQDLFLRAGDEKDKKYRDEMVSLATTDYQKALPNLEKSLELNTVNVEIKKETLDCLKRIYYKLQMTDKYNEASQKLKDL
jgi:tetratricopeptide (TPR) repeat protein